MPERNYTVREWEKLPERPRYELIDGVLKMQAQPTVEHQDIGVQLIIQIGSYLRGKQCRVLYETAVRLNEADETIFAPDLIVVCDPNKIKRNYVLGAPDLVIETLSRSTAGLDKTLKLTRYQQAGVREYWIVDPVHQIVDVLQWEKGSTTQTYTREDRIHVGVLDDCEVDLSLVFPELEDEEMLEIEQL